MKKEYYLSTSTAPYYPVDSFVYSNHDRANEIGFEDAHNLMLAYLQRVSNGGEDPTPWGKQVFGKHQAFGKFYYICHLFDGRYNHVGRPIFSVFGVAIPEKDAENYTLEDFARYLNHLKSTLKITHPDDVLTVFDVAEKSNMKWGPVAKWNYDLVETNLQSKFAHIHPTHAGSGATLGDVDWLKLTAKDDTFVNLDNYGPEIENLPKGNTISPDTSDRSL